MHSTRLLYDPLQLFEACGTVGRCRRSTSTTTIHSRASTALPAKNRSTCVWMIVQCDLDQMMKQADAVGSIACGSPSLADSLAFTSCGASHGKVHHCPTHFHYSVSTLLVGHTCRGALSRLMSVGRSALDLEITWK